MVESAAELLMVARPTPASSGESISGTTYRQEQQLQATHLAPARRHFRPKMEVSAMVLGCPWLCLPRSCSWSHVSGATYLQER